MKPISKNQTANRTENRSQSTKQAIIEAYSTNKIYLKSLWDSSPLKSKRFIIGKVYHENRIKRAHNDLRGLRQITVLLLNSPTDWLLELPVKS